MAKTIEDRFIDQLNNYLGQHLLNTNLVIVKIVNMNPYIQKRLMVLIVNLITLWATMYKNDPDSIPENTGALVNFLNDGLDEWQKYCDNDLPWD